MTQAITNTLSSTNPQAGLLGLTPKPKATPNPNIAAGLSINSLGNVAGSNANPSNATIAGLLTSSLPKAPATTATPTTTSSSVIPATPQQFASTTIPQPITGNTTTPSGAVVNTTTGQVITPAPGQSTGTPGLFSSVLSSLAGVAPANAALGANAQKIAADAGQQIADIGGQGARFAAGQKTTGTSPVAEGNAAVTAQTTAAQQQAVAQGANVALQGNQQALSAQGQTQSALNAAAGLAQPNPAAYGQTVFDPTTGTYSGGGGLPAEVMQQYASMAVNGQYSAIPSFITSNPVLNAQLNVAAKALNPNFNPVQATGASGVLAGIPALQSANTAAEGIKNTINSYIAANPQLNPSDLAAGNILQQWIQGKQLTDPKYQTLFNYLNEYTNTLAPILGVGGDATNLKTQIAQGMVNAAASGQSITQVLNNMSQLASNKIQDLQNGAVGGSTTVPASQSTTGGLFDW